MKILDTAIKQGPTLNFINPLPVKERTVTAKKSLLLEVCLDENDQPLILTSEIPLLENYSLFTEENIKESYDIIKDRLKNIDLLSAVEMAINHMMPAPLLLAFEVIKFKSLNITKYQPIKVRALNDFNSNAFKLKISKSNLNEILENLKEHYSNNKKIQVTLDANQKLEIKDWNLFFEKYKTFNYSRNVQLIIEEPLSFEKLTKDHFYQNFIDNNIQIAVDEGLANWYFQGLEEKEIQKRLSYYQNIVFKPGMITLLQVENILKTSKHITPQNIFLSCLYEGPWNLAYFFYISWKLKLTQPAGLSPLLNIKENATYLQVNASKSTLTLTL